MESKAISMKFHFVEPWKIFLFMFLTLGFYQVYWFYKNWCLVRNVIDYKIWPIPRSLFSIFFVYELFDRILGSAKENGYKGSYTSGKYTILYVLLTLTTIVLNKVNSESLEYFMYIILVQLLISIPFFTTQKVINFNNNHIDKQ